jgi:hypothetical protein
MLWSPDCLQNFCSVAEPDNRGKLNRLAEIGKIFVLLGAALVVVGLVLVALAKSHVPIGHLPGDISYRGKNVAFYFPLGTSLLISVILSLIFYFFTRLRR